jgi:hypothetical protein
LDTWSASTRTSPDLDPDTDKAIWYGDNSGCRCSIWKRIKKKKELCEAKTVSMNTESHNVKSLEIPDCPDKPCIFLLRKKEDTVKG